MGKKVQNTAFHYFYRDASNYKLFGKVILSGALTTEEKLSVGRYLYDGEFFIPSVLGLESLPDQEGWDRGEDDHPFHTFDEVEDSHEEPTSGVGSARELLEKLKSMDTQEWEKAAAQWERDVHEASPWSGAETGPFL